jgi:hypothetical protein
MQSGELLTGLAYFLQITPLLGFEFFIWASEKPDRFLDGNTVSNARGVGS